MSKTVLVTGATGLLGRQIVKAFNSKGWNAVGTGLSRASPPQILKLDLCDAAAIEQTLDEVKPQVIVHSAAQRFPDKVDADPTAATALNETASGTLAAACIKRKIFVIYISTDYVFPGTPGDAPYETTATPHPTTKYGETKLAGEHAVLDAAGKTGLAVVLRVPVLYGPADKPEDSAVNVLLRVVQDATSTSTSSTSKGNGPVKVDAWAQRYPTHTEDVGRVCADIANVYLAALAGETEEGKEMPRVLQFTAEERMTKYDMCCTFAEILGLSLEQGQGIVANEEGNDPKSPVQRPYDCHLSTKALRGIGVDVGAQGFAAFWRWQIGAYRH